MESALTNSKHRDRFRKTYECHSKLDPAKRLRFFLRTGNFPYNQVLTQSALRFTGRESEWGSGRIHPFIDDVIATQIGRVCI